MLVKQLPASLMDLAKPQWAGKIGIAPSDADFLPLVSAVIRTQTDTDDVMNTTEVRRGGAEVKLTGKEYDILRLLIRHRGEVISRDRMLNEVWGYDAYPATRTVDSHIVKLRQKIEDNPADPKYILSIYGEGYKFVG